MSSGRVGTILLSVEAHDQDLAACVLFDELLHGHLDEHVIVNFVRAATFELAGDPTIDRSLLHLLLAQLRQSFFGIMLSYSLVLDRVAPLLLLVL